MHCRDSETLLLSERDGVLSPGELAALESHVGGCEACRKYRVELATALAAYREAEAAVTLPDRDAEWRKVRARLAGKPPRNANRRPIAPLVWLAAPFAAAAAIALVYFGGGAPATPPPTGFSAATEVARAEYVEAGNADASTVVYVDKDSGWLVVWAADGTLKSG